MAKYVFPAKFTKDGDGYSVDFPDISGCFTCGDSMADALEMAEDALCLRLYDMEEDNETIPPPSDYKSIRADKDSVISLIHCDTVEYRKFYDKKSIKKTLTIPNWLNSLAEREKINFSGTLQDALMQKLNIG